VQAALIQTAWAEASSLGVNDAPDPYRRGVRFAPLPDGRNWGSTAGVAVAPDGTIWAYDRCGANSCAGSSLDPIIAFHPTARCNLRCEKGIRFGRRSDARVLGLIPDQQPMSVSSAAEGVGVDRTAMYSAPRPVRRT
jgi:hypothetical protein